MDTSLPTFSFALLPSTNEIICITRGMQGYNPTTYPNIDQSTNTALVKYINGALHISDAQAEAMLIGSMFGWDVPGAYVSNSDEDKS